MTEVRPAEAKETRKPRAAAAATAPVDDQPDPRVDRLASDKTRAVAGYADNGTARTFHLLAGEDLPTGYADAPPKGTHPNDPGR